MKVVYSKDAIQSLEEILDFLNYKWTQKEINVFREDLHKLIEILDEGTIVFPKVSSNNILRYAWIGKKQVKVYFDLHSDHVEFLLFLPSKGDPQKLLKILNK